MATSLRVSKRKRPKAKSRMKHPLERTRVRHKFDPERGQTHQSFKDECDITRILAQHQRTGMVQHLQRGEPQYGEAPDQSLFEAACVQAEIRSAEHDGYEYSPEAASEPRHGVSEAELDSSADDAPEGHTGAHSAPEKAMESPTTVAGQ